MWHTEEERSIALTEYAQGNELVKHYDTLDWIVGSIFIPISLGLLGLSYTDQAIKQIPSSLIVLAIASISIYFIWLCLDNRYGYFCKIIYSRLREIERQYGMDLHQKIHRIDSAQPFRETRRASFWIKIIGIVLCVIWFVRIFSAIPVSFSW